MQPLHRDSIDNSGNKEPEQFGGIYTGKPFPTQGEEEVSDEEFQMYDEHLTHPLLKEIRHHMS